MKRIPICLFIMSTLAFSLTIQPVLGDTFGTFPADSGMQITYSVSGAAITSTEDQYSGTVRIMKGTLGTGNLMVSGSAKGTPSICGDLQSRDPHFYTSITVRVWVDGDERTYTAPDPVECESASGSYSFSLSVPIPAGAKEGGFNIVETYTNLRVGSQSVQVRGTFGPPVPRIDSGARFSGISGQVEIRPDSDPNGWKLAKTETIIYVDDHIKTDEDSTAIIGFPDMTVFVMKRETEVVVSTPPRQDSLLKLVFGNIWVNVKKMIKDGSMAVEMNQAAASIKGTIFALEETGSTSTLKVADGSVEITNKVTGETLTIYAGEKVTAGKRDFGSKQRFDAESELAELEKEIPGSSRLMERITSTTGKTPGVTAKRTTPKPGATTPQGTTGDFTVSISPTEMTVNPGEKIQFTLTIEPEGDFNEPVEIYVKTEALGIEKNYGRVKIINPPYKPYVFESTVPDEIPKGTTITGYVTAKGGGLERDAGTVIVNIPGFGTLLAIGAIGMAILLRKRR